LEIPLHAPIYRALAQVQEFNETTERMRTVLSAAYPELVGLVTNVMERAPLTRDAYRTVEHWRETANALAAKEAGYAFQVYARLKTFSIIDLLVDLTNDLGAIHPASPIRARLADEILMWANRRGAIAPEGPLSMADDSQRQQWVDFLIRFDIEFRRRRLSFVTRGLNLLYSQLKASSFQQVKPHHIDDLKSGFQTPLSRLRRSHLGDFASATLRARIADLATSLGIAVENNAGATGAARDSLNREIDGLMEQLYQELDLGNIDRVVDAVVASSMVGDVPTALRHAVLIYYIGFPFWDAWTFPISEWRTVEEHREIRVDRISPDDAVLLRNGASTTRLKGAEFRHFAGFLSRSRREHDYLWGRLHGAERLIDIVCDAAAMEGAMGKTDIRILKKTAFLAILGTEEHRLLDKNLLALVRSEVSKL
jgi:patatin-related protein